MQCAVPESAVGDGLVESRLTTSGLRAVQARPAPLRKEQRRRTRSVACRAVRQASVRVDCRPLDARGNSLSYVRWSRDTRIYE
jgi:hypothetical protein